jgi:hypothetical protein
MAILLSTRLPAFWSFSKLAGCSVKLLTFSQNGVEKEVQELVPGYMAMGEHGMDEMTKMSGHMKGPDNTLPMMGGDGPFGSVGMGGMFTILKVRDHLKSYDQDPEWYQHAKGTVAELVSQEKDSSTTQTTPVYTCPMHPEVQQNKPGKCPKCGMTLVEQEKTEEVKSNAQPQQKEPTHEHSH